MSSETMQDDFSVEPFFNVVEAGMLVSFEHSSFEFLEDFDVFALAEIERHTRPRATRADAWSFPLPPPQHLEDISR